MLEPSYVLALGSADLDITDRAQVATLFRDFAPNVVINCAAYTAVDKAESDEERAYEVNAIGPGLLAAESARAGSKLIHLSTDYVFDGNAETPYKTTDPTGPLSAYGRTKLAGEQAVRELGGHVVRTAWLLDGFVARIIDQERTQETVSVVTDQRGSPTWVADLARALVELGRSDAPAGIYHCTGSGDITRFGLARAIFEELGADSARVLPATSDRFPRSAIRPAYSVLDNSGWTAAGLTVLPHWRDALRSAFSANGDAFGAHPVGVHPGEQGLFDASH